MKTALTILPFVLSFCLIVWTFTHVLRTGRMARALMVNWGILVLVIGSLCSLQTHLHRERRLYEIFQTNSSTTPYPHEELIAALPDGQNLFGVLVFGWGHGLVPGGIAKILHVRRRKIAEQQELRDPTS
ncbi:MAG TPA: hypothetical protein VI454_20970 [Verrucomicrobiae bacterium]|jgi:hypothetical protein